MLSLSTRDKGFAQIVVLGGIAALAALLLGTLPLMQSASVAVAASERLVRGEILSRSAFDRVLSALDARDDPFEQSALREPQTLSVAGQSILVSLVGEAGKVDVGLTDLALAMRLAQNAGPPQTELDRFEAELSTARQDEDIHRAMDVARRWLSPLQLDVDAVLTMYGSGLIDPTYAHAEVLAAIPDLDPAEAAEILAANPLERGRFAEFSRYLSANSRRFTIVAQIEWSPDQVSIRRLPIELSTSGQAVVLGGAY